MKTFDEILPQFLANVKIRVKERAYSAYKGKARVFSEWLSKNGFSGLPLSEITEQHIEQFSIYLANERKLDRPTCQKYMTLLKQIYQYGMSRGEATKIPTDLFVLPVKGEDKSAAVIQKEDLKKLTDYISKKDKQLHIATMTEYYCGARPGREVRLLKVNNFNLTDGVLRIDSDSAKTGKARYITMSVDFIKLCKEYGIDKANPDHYVFGVNKRIGDKPVSENTLRCRFNTCRRKLGISNKVKLYSYKHTAASMLIKNKILGMEELRQHLGHTSISSTQYYVKQIGGGINMDLRNSFPSPY